MQITGAIIAALALAVGVNGQVRCQNGVRIVGPNEYDQSCNTNQFGTVLTRATGPGNINGCEISCNKTPGCVATKFNKNSRVCTHLSSVGAMVRNTAFDSAVQV